MPALDPAVPSQQSGTLRKLLWRCAAMANSQLQVAAVLHCTQSKQLQWEL